MCRAPSEKTDCGIDLLAPRQAYTRRRRLSSRPHIFTITISSLISENSQKLHEMIPNADSRFSFRSIAYASGMAKLLGWTKR